MQGFKSFADPVTIDFHEGITCIVGPNGSGKSNISDAVRWVLGEQSPKALRGGKMEEVIFSGTASRKSRGMAEVVLVIDNSTGILDIDYNEVAITRRMYRSGESEYLINNNPCRLRDIRELIMDTGIGVDGYSIIGQGKIADIVSTKPEARREIFEEAAGIVMYKNRRAEAERKLESAGTNLDRVSDIITEIESRIGTLREDSIKAKEYLELKERYEGLEINVILKNIDTIEENGRIYKDDLVRITNEIETITREHQEVFTRLGELSEKRELVEKLSSETRDKILALVQEINEMTSASKLSAERLSGIEKETEMISSDLTMLRARLAEEEESLSGFREEENSLSKEIAEAESVLSEKISQYNESAAEQAKYAREADEGRSKIFELNRELTMSDSEIKGVENLADTLKGRKEDLVNLAGEAGKASAEIEALLKDKKSEITIHEEKRDSLEKEITDSIASWESIKTSISELTEGIERNKLDVSKLSSRRVTMEEMESNYEGYNAGVRSLMKAGLGGIHGVVTELITVPKGYELAIETALGQNLQDIVCEKDEDAKRGVNYLKDNKAGRVTFLPIETIRGKDRDASSIKNDEGFIDLAVNIISCDDKYKEVYKYLLGKVAVAKDMDAAIRLAKKGTGLRFVTKEGEIVNTAGAITGGAYKNRTASFLERKAEIAELAVQLKTLEDIILKDGNALASQKNNLLTMEESIDRLRDEKHQIEITLGALAGDLKAAGDSYSKETSSLTRYEDEMTRIERQLSDIEDLKSGHIKRIEEIKAEIEEVTNAVQAATEKADAQKLITDERSEAVTGARINLNEVSTRVDAQKRLADKVASQIEEYKRQIEEKEQTGTALLAEKEELIALRSEDSAVEEKLNEKETLENSLRDLARDKEAVLNEQKEFELAQGDATNRINDLRDQKYQIEIKSAKGDTQLETLKEKLWEEFEISYAQALDRRVDDFVYSKAVKETREIRSRIRELGDVHVGAIAEYEKESERYEFFTAQRDDITKARDELRSIISDMDKTIRIKFKENFDKVVENFEVIFKELFGGGQAELRLEDENDPLNSGIEIVAQPPGKKLQNINLMSGGEKTMTAIALMFAVLKTKPTPFCILDEVEAALDDNNIDRFANYLKNFQEIQFALVTHQKATMEHADVLYGVTMPEQGISKMLSLRLGDDFDLD